jgi:FecR protein
MHQSFSIERKLIVIALAGIYPLLAQATAGVAQFSVGEVSLQRTTGVAPLPSGARVESGDLITTGNSGRTQLRFTDGGMVSLQPNSQFKISKYADTGDGKQDSFLVDFARGGMRALTGLIGKRNRDNYKVTTTTATIGIRGSGFSMAYNTDGTLGITTELDAIEVCTKAGCIGLNVGESAIVTSADALPTRTRERASWNPPNPRRLITARNDDTNSSGAPSNLLAPPKVTVPTNLAFTSAGLNVVSELDERFYTNGTATFNGSNFVGYQSQAGNIGSLGSATVLNRTGSIEGGDLLVLGTWDNSVWSQGNQDTRVPVSAFVTGQVTAIPQAGLSSLFPSGATYQMASSTPVFSSQGEAGVLDFGRIDIDFLSRQPVSVSLQVSFGGSNNPVGASGPSVAVAAPATYYLFGSGSPTGAGFKVPLNVTGGNCSELACSGNAQGFFVGPKADTAGLSFTANTGANGHGNIGGAATFTRGPLITNDDLARRR